MSQAGHLTVLLLVPHRLAVLLGQAKRAREGPVDFVTSVLCTAW